MPKIEIIKEFSGDIKSLKKPTVIKFIWVGICTFILYVSEVTRAPKSKIFSRLNTLQKRLKFERRMKPTKIRGDEAPLFKQKLYFNIIFL